MTAIAKSAVPHALRTNDDPVGEENRGELTRPLVQKGSPSANSGQAFDCVETWLREVPTPLRMTVPLRVTSLRDISFKVGFLFAARDCFPGGRSRPRWWRLRPARKISAKRSLSRALCRLCTRS